MKKNEKVNENRRVVEGKNLRSQKKEEKDFHNCVFHIRLFYRVYHIDCKRWDFSDPDIWSRKPASFDHLHQFKRIFYDRIYRVCKKPTHKHFFDSRRPQISTESNEQRFLFYFFTFQNHVNCIFVSYLHWNLNVYTSIVLHPVHCNNSNKGWCNL